MTTLRLLLASTSLAVVLTASNANAQSLHPKGLSQLHLQEPRQPLPSQCQSEAARNIG